MIFRFVSFGFLGGRAFAAMRAGSWYRRKYSSYFFKFLSWVDDDDDDDDDEDAAAAHAPSLASHVASASASRASNIDPPSSDDGGSTSSACQIPSLSSPAAAGPPDRNGPAPVGVHASGVNPKRPVPGQPFLQSARLRVPEGSSGLSKGMITKLALILEELGVPPRPTPTKLVCDAYDALRRDIVSLLSLQKLATQKEAELKALRVAYEEQRAHASRAHASSGRKDHPAQHGQGNQKRKMPPPTPSHADDPVALARRRTTRR